MNSLYGRFGINPESTVSELCSKERYEELMMKDNFIYGNGLSDHYYIVSYITNRGVDNHEWNPPRVSAVQLAGCPDTPLLWALRVV